MKENKLIGKRLLVLTPCYPDSENRVVGNTFVKDQVEKIASNFKKVYVISARPYFKGLKDYSYGNICVYYPRFFHLPIKYFRDRLGENQFKAVAQLIKREGIEFDLIHAHFTTPCGWIAVALKKGCNKNCLLTIGENRNWLLKKYYEGDIRWTTAWKENDLLIRVNKLDIPLLQGYNKNTIHLPYGYDEELFFSQDKGVCRAKLGMPKDKKVIINVANLVIAHKNQINLLLAMNELLKRRKDVILYLVGGGKDRRKIEGKIAELSLGSYVKLTGPIKHEKLALYMNSADLFVLPSYAEGFSVAQLEAMGCGKPVVATVNGGSEEAIISEDYGFLVKDPNDYVSLATRMGEALDRKWDQKRITEYAKKYSGKGIAKELLGRYSGLIE